MALGELRDRPQGPLTEVPFSHGHGSVMVASGLDWRKRETFLSQLCLDSQHGSTQTVLTVKNITLSLDEDVFMSVRRYAVEHNSAVNRLVRDYLTQIADRQDRARLVRQQIRSMSRESKARVGRTSWSRKQLHDR